MKTCPPCNHNCRQGRDCPCAARYETLDVIIGVIIGALAALVVSFFIR